MWLVLFCLIAAVTSGKTENAFEDEEIGPKNYFEDHMLRELESTEDVIFPMDELDIVGIEKEYFTALRNLRLSEYPVLRITSVDSSPSLFSTRIGIDFGDIIFTGKIYINEDTPSVGDLRFILKNVKASGHVGLTLSKGRFISTNYLITYESDDHPDIQIQSGDQRLSEWTPKLSENLLKRGTRKLLNAMLKRRFDFALSKISVTDVYGAGRSDVKSKKEWLRSFYDKVVDSLLENVNKRFVDDNTVKVALPDIDLPFTYRIMSFPVRGRVSGSNGWLRNLGTFVRRGSVSVSIVSGSMIIFGGLGLEELKLGYEDCTVTVGGIGPSGHLSGTVGNNAAEIAVLVNMVNLTINLEHFEITKLSDLDVELSGLGVFDWLASKIAGWLMNGLIGNVVPIIEPMIRDQIVEALENIDPSVLI